MCRTWGTAEQFITALIKKEMGVPHRKQSDEADGEQIDPHDGKPKSGEIFIIISPGDVSMIMNERMRTILLGVSDSKVFSMIYISSAEN